MEIGSFIAREKILECQKCGRIYTSGELAKLIPWGCGFGYDVLVYVGKSVFLDCRNEGEIIQDLWERNIPISSSSIRYLARKFIIYLAIAHRDSHAMLKEAMGRRGGYILHFDATCEGDSPHLMSGLDGISEIVLDNIKLPSENGEKIIPFLQRIKKAFGTPVALVRDMGKGISNAILEVFPDTRDFICHYHFLRDIGKDLFGKENDTIRTSLKQYGIQGLLRKMAAQFKKVIDTNPDILDCFAVSLNVEKIEERAMEQIPQVTAYAMIQWALDGKKQGNGYGFPFDHPYLVFYQRLVQIYSQCERLQEMDLRGQSIDNKPFLKICCLLQDALSDRALFETSVQMQEKVFVFDKLRDAMRIADPEQTQGLNDDGEDAPIKTIETDVKEFRQWLKHDKCLSQNKEYEKMIEQIDRYWEKLFADPIVVDTPQGKMTIQPQRTNNILERFFRDIKRGYRKRDGTNAMSKTLKAMLADTPLVRNLRNPEYLKIILDGKATLEERFADIDAKKVRQELRKAQENLEKIPSIIKRIIKEPNMLERVEKLFAKQRKT